MKVDEILWIENFNIPNSHEAIVQESYIQMRDKKSLDELKTINEDLPVMNSECILSIGIPVYKEWQNIYKALYEYTNK